MAFGLVMIGSSGAFADDPAPVVSAPATPGKKLCKVTDSNLDELSGLVATKSGYIVINDSSQDSEHKRVFFLDTKCKVVKKVSFSGDGPRDTEDLILSPDGKKLWIADTGDNDYTDENESRSSVVLWTMNADGASKPVLHRLSYPAGDHHDSEALLLNGDGIPLIVTKEVGKPAYIYQPTGPLKSNNDEGVPLKRVGEITISGTTTSGPPIARIGNRTVVGGAIFPGGTKVALRTYTDALEWDVKNGDVLGALKEKPRTTGLPDEPQGEAITYSADGKSFLTVSDMSGDEKAANYIRSYTPATKVAAVAKGGGVDGGKKWYDGVTIGQVKSLLGGVGLLGLILVGAGVFGIVKHRKKVRNMPAPSSDDFESPLAGDPETELIGVGGAPQKAGVYGAGGGAAVAGARSGPGPVYGSGGGSASGQRGGGTPAYGRPNGQQPSRNGSGPQGQPARGGPQGQPPRGPQGQPARGPQGQPARGPQGQPARGPQGQPARGPQGQPARGPQGQPARGGSQGEPARGGSGGARGPQGQPARGPQGQPARGPQGQPARGPQGQPARGGSQGEPARGGSGGARGPQGQPAGGPQGQPARAPQGQPPRGGQPARAPQPPRGPQGQPARAPQGQSPRGGQPARAPQPPRGPQGQPARGPQGQPPRGPQGQPPRGSQAQPGRSDGVYDQSPRGDGYSDYHPRREDRYDNPGYGRR
jgi:hypothetical protein